GRAVRARRRADRAPGRTALQPGGRIDAGADREGLEAAQAPTGRDVGGGDPAGLSKRPLRRAVFGRAANRGGSNSVKRVLLVLVVVAIGTAIAAGAWLYLLVGRPYQGYSEPEVFVEITPGSGPVAMGRKLADAGVVRSPAAFRIAVWMRDATR